MIQKTGTLRDQTSKGEKSARKRKKGLVKSQKEYLRITILSGIFATFSQRLQFYPKNSAFLE